MAIAAVNGVNLSYDRVGSGPLLVLLHGWPQTGHCWHHLVGPLSDQYTVVAPDLRGYGRSSKPIDGHDKRTKAQDLHELIGALGFDSATVIGHDRGARVAHRWALDHPGDIDRLVVMDIIPTREMWRRMDADLAVDCFHWLLQMQPDVADLLTDPAAYVRYFLERWAHVPLPDADIAVYERAFSAPGAMRCGFADYSSAIPTDADHDDADFGRRLTMPVLALWGGHSFLRNMDPLAIWRDYAEDVAGGPIADCGHFMAEEQPDAVLAALREFL